MKILTNRADGFRRQIGINFFVRWGVPMMILTLSACQSTWIAPADPRVADDTRRAHEDAGLAQSYAEQAKIRLAMIESTVKDGTAEIRKIAQEAKKSAGEAQAFANKSDQAARQTEVTAAEIAKANTAQLVNELVVSVKAQAKEAQENAAKAKTAFELTGELTAQVRKLQTRSSPRIYNIGNCSTLTFSKDGVGGKATPTDIQIPVMGRGLYSPSRGDSPISSTAACLQVRVLGTVPIDEREWGFDADTGKADNEFGIVIKGDYLKRLQTGDRLDVVVMMNQPLLASDGRQPLPVAIAQRTFTFYTVEDYRKVLARRIPITDIQAFPLPDSEATDLFGPVIARDFFVVKLTLRNNDLTAEERLVNVGMISASGRLLVEPRNEREPSFTLPVKVSPQSPIQVFAVMEAREDSQVRPWVFRSLEFAGALGTAYLTAFPQGADATKWAALSTGVFLPEFRKLWPDKWPSYKRNLVNFGMPELVKVPRSASTTPKFIFFSKKDLELIISDPNIFDRGVTQDPKGLYNDLRVGLRRLMFGDGKPSVHVLSLEFDGLDIPFENVLTPTETDLHEEVMLLQSDLPSLRTSLESLRDRWATQHTADGIDFSTLTAMADKLDKISVKVPGDGGDPTKVSPDEAKVNAAFRDHLDQLKKLAELLAGMNASNNEIRTVALEAKEGASLANMPILNEQLGVVLRRLLGGGDANTLKERISGIKTQTAYVKSVVEFSETAADTLSYGKDPALKAAVDGLLAAVTASPAPADMAAFRKDEKNQKFIDEINLVYETLKATRTVKIAKNFAPEEYKAMK